MQTDPIDDRTLIDGTGSLVTYLVVSGTLEAFYLKGDGSQITNLNLGGTNAYSSSQQVLNSLLNQDLVVKTLTAQQYVISSSVVNIETIAVSGSTRFGDTIDDRHEFTGSLFVLGPVYATSFSGTFEGAISSSAQLLALGFITGSGSFNGTVEWDNILNKPANLISGSGQRPVLGLGESDSPTFANLYATNMDLLGNLVVAGTITARTYVVSSSVVNIQSIDVSGSTRFGDTTDDRHERTGSVYTSGSFFVPYKNTLEPVTDTGSLAISGSDLYIYI